MRLKLIDGVHQAKSLFLVAPRPRITQIEQHHVAPLAQITQTAGLKSLIARVEKAGPKARAIASARPESWLTKQTLTGG